MLFKFLKISFFFNINPPRISKLNTSVLIIKVCLVSKIILYAFLQQIENIKTY